MGGLGKRGREGASLGLKETAMVDEVHLRASRTHEESAHTPSTAPAKRLRDRLAEKLAAKRARRGSPLHPASRYDEVFWQGVDWLDSL